MKLSLTPDTAVLLVVDWQERIASAMPADVEQRGRRNTAILLEAARLLNVPVVLSEQYPKGLGPTVPELSAAASAASATRVEKLEFACTSNPDFQRIAAQYADRSWVVCGMETHVCVYQSVRGLRSTGGVHVVADAVTSRTEDNRRIGLDLCRGTGATITSTETVVFDLLQRASGDAFKTLSKLVR